MITTKVEINDGLFEKIQQYFAKNFKAIDHTLTNQQRAEYFIRAGFAHFGVVKVIYGTNIKFMERFDYEQ